MMKQYAAAKAQSGDALLLFRMGDFYELFFDDAVQASAALDIALTKRGRHLGEDIPMCGVPVHAADGYLSRLIRGGFRVAICEQMEDPAQAKKRGGSWVRVALDPDNPASDEGADIAALVDALEKLEQFDSRKADVVKLRMLCGLTVAEVAEALGVAKATVERDWSFAKAWLGNELGG